MLPNSATALPQSAPITDWARRLDEESLLELIRHYQPLLKVLAKRSWDKRLQSKIDPSDALQQTWTSISKHAGKTHFEDRRHFYSYLRKVLRNHITDIKRLLLQSQKRSDGREIVFAENDRFLHASLDARYLRIKPPIQQITDREMAEHTLLAILRLPRELQRLIRWRFRKEMTYEQIAQRLGRRPDEIRYVINKCLKGLEKDLRQRFPGSSAS